MKTSASPYIALSFLAALSSVTVGQNTQATLDAMTVLGLREDTLKQVGSATYLSQEELRKSNATNINQILTKVPGVYTREEDGFGNFPNISIRGANASRSEKITMMEDGILVAPAPYTSPGAYTTPHVARMAGVEILKGSSQVRYGPQTTGGVINFLSTPIPQDAQSYAKVTYGSFNTLFGHIHTGDTQTTSAGKVGYLVELHGQQSDGFRNIDLSSRNSGFTLYEPMIKLSFEPNTALKQRLEFKAGLTSFDGNETYTGISESDLNRNPDRRYAASKFDNMDSKQYRSYLKWIAEPSAAVRLESAAYYSYFTRNWYKLQQVKATGGVYRGIHNALANTNPFPNELGVLKGTAAGELDVRANDRSYSAYGWQNQANYRFDALGAEHDLAGGLRLHYDYQEMDHSADTYIADGLGNFNYSSTTRIGQTNRTEEILATAVFIEDEIKTGKLTLKPGIRYEWLSLDSVTTNNSTRINTRDDGSNTLFTAGIGTNYQLDEYRALFGGVYRGVSSPGVTSTLSGVKEEKSIGYELGFRHQQDAFRFEVASFLTDFQNLIATDTGLGGEPNGNAGEAEVYGLETIAQYDLGRANNFSFAMPVYASATWTSAEFKDTTAGLSGGGEGSIYAGGKDGNEIPYTPQWKLATGIGIATENWGANLDANYTSSTWGTGYNGATRTGTATSRDGKMDSLVTVNFSSYYQINPQFRLLAGVQNLFDERAIVSRIPEGPRANAPRSIYTGIEAKF